MSPDRLKTRKSKCLDAPTTWVGDAYHQEFMDHFSPLPDDKLESLLRPLAQTLRQNRLKPLVRALNQLGEVVESLPEGLLAPKSTQDRVRQEKILTAGFIFNQVRWLGLIKGRANGKN